MDLGGLGNAFHHLVDDLTHRGGAPAEETAAPPSTEADQPARTAPPSPQAPSDAPAQPSSLLSSIHMPSLPSMPHLPSLHDIQASIGASVEARLGPGSTEHIGWLQAPGEPPTRNITARFEALYAAAQAGQSTLPSDANQYHYLTIGGLFTQHYNGYLDPNREELSKLGLDVHNVGINTDESVAVNAQTIRQAILDASRDGHQVVLIGHSKGGVDLTAALSLYPELRAHVRAVVSMQAPYGGTPMASDIENSSHDRSSGLVGAVDHFITGVLHGNPESLSDLSYEARQAFVRGHPYPASDIPTISLSSSCTTAASATSPAQAYMQARYGEASDGLVLTRDAEIPGSNVVRLQNLDHNGSVWDNALEKAMQYRPASLTESLITLALTTPPAERNE